jgi:spermidine synthase
MHIDLVEREQGVIDLARRWFDLDGVPDIVVHVEDGTDFVVRAPAGTWDVVVVDAYDSSDPVPACGDLAFLRELRRILTSDGAFAYNLIGTLDGKGAAAEVVAHAQMIFDDVRVVPVIAPTGDPGWHATRNVVVVGRRRG